MITEAIREMITCQITLSVFHTPVILNSTSTVVEKDIMDQIIADAEQRARNPDYAEGLIVRDPTNRTVIEKSLRTGLYYHIDYRTKSFIEALIAEHPELKDEQYQPQPLQTAALVPLPTVIAAPIPMVPMPPVAVAPAFPEPMVEEAMPVVAPRIPVAQQNIFAERREERLIALPVAIAITSDIRAPQNEEALVKVLCLGDIGSNKERFINAVASVSDGKHHYKAILGVDFRLTVVHDVETRTTLRFCLWDVAGQERFGNMTRVHYKEAGIALFFDVEHNRGGMQKWMKDVSDKLGKEEGRRADIKFFTISYGENYIAELTPVIDEEIRRMPALAINYVANSRSLGRELLIAAYKVSQGLRAEAEAAAAAAVALIQPAAVQEEPGRGCVIA